jgi:hypothetical protein
VRNDQDISKIAARERELYPFQDLYWTKTNKFRALRAFHSAQLNSSAQVQELEDELHNDWIVNALVYQNSMGPRVSEYEVPDSSILIKIRAFQSLQQKLDETRETRRNLNLSDKSVQVNQGVAENDKFAKPADVMMPT